MSKKSAKLKKNRRLVVDTKMAPLLDSVVISDQNVNSAVAVSVAALVSVMMVIVSVSICGCCGKKKMQTAAPTNEEQVPKWDEPITPDTETPSVISPGASTAQTEAALPAEANAALDGSSIPHPDQAGSFKLTSHREGSLRQVGKGTNDIPSLKLMEHTDNKSFGHAPPISKEPKSQSVGYASPMSKEMNSYSVGLQHQHQRPESKPSVPRPTPETKEDTDGSVIIGRKSMPPAPSPRPAVPAPPPATTARTTAAAAGKNTGTKLTSKSVAPSPKASRTASPVSAPRPVATPKKAVGKTTRGPVSSRMASGPPAKMPAARLTPTRSVPTRAVTPPGGAHRKGPDDSELDVTSRLD